MVQISQTNPIPGGLGWLECFVIAVKVKRPGTQSDLAKCPSRQFLSVSQTLRVLV
ncbi:MAG: hypothetical protein AAGA03_05855 [Planctomycetota bacterium]